MARSPKLKANFGTEIGSEMANLIQDGMKTIEVADSHLGISNEAWDELGQLHGKNYLTTYLYNANLIQLISLG